MAQELECPVCNADIPLTGDERIGDEIFCVYCRAPLTVKHGKDGEMLLEDDF